MYYINKIPRYDKRQTHRILGLKLKALLQHLWDPSCGYSKVAALEKLLSVSNTFFISYHALQLLTERFYHTKQHVSYLKWEVCYGSRSYRFHHSMCWYPH